MKHQELGWTLFEIALHFMYYNFCKTHRTLANPYPRTPAMASGITDHVWSAEEIVKLTYNLTTTI